MVLNGGIEVPVTLEIVEPGARYLDRLTMGDLVIEIDHVVARATAAPRSRSAPWSPVPGAEDIGPMVTADAPKAMETLGAMAEGRA